jgi:hypothetical protein
MAKGRGAVTKLRDKMKAQGLLAAKGGYARHATTPIVTDSEKFVRLGSDTLLGKRTVYGIQRGDEQPLGCVRRDGQPSRVTDDKPVESVDWRALITPATKVMVCPSGHAIGLSRDIGKVGKSGAVASKSAGSDGGAKRSRHGKRIAMPRWEVPAADAQWSIVAK